MFDNIDKFEAYLENLHKNIDESINELASLEERENRLINVINESQSELDRIRSNMEPLKNRIDSLHKVISEYDVFRSSLQLLLSDFPDIDESINRLEEYMNRPRGKQGGRPKADPAAVKKAVEMYNSGKYYISEIEKVTGIKKSTLYRNVKG